MSTQILMPALSPTMEEGTLAKWHVREGDQVRAGDVIAEIETDKATMEVEAVEEGRIETLLVPEGTEHVKVNQPIALLLAGRWPTLRSTPRRAVAARMRRGEGCRRATESPSPLTPTPRPIAQRPRSRPPRRSCAQTATRGASSPRRSRGASPASAGSTLPPSKARVRAAASSRRTSRGLRHVRKRAPQPRSKR